MISVTASLEYRMRRVQHRVRTAAQFTIPPVEPVTAIVFYGGKINPTQWRRAYRAIKQVVAATPSIHFVPQPGKAPYIAVQESVRISRGLADPGKAVRMAATHTTAEDVSMWDLRIGRFQLETSVSMQRSGWVLVTNLDDDEIPPQFTRLLLTL